MRGRKGEREEGREGGREEGRENAGEREMNSWWSNDPGQASLANIKRGRRKLEYLAAAVASSLPPSPTRAGPIFMQLSPQGQGLTERPEEEM